MYRDDPDGFLTLLPRFSQVENLKACFIIGMIAILMEHIVDENSTHWNLKAPFAKLQKVDQAYHSI